MLCFLAPGCKRPAAPSPDGAPSPVRFEDVTLQAGITFTEPPLPRPLSSLGSFGMGCGFFDFDRDDRPDLLLLGTPSCALYRNRGDGTFQDVSRASGLASFRGRWLGCAVGDFDGDGWTDLYLTGFHQGVLLRNLHGRRFEDASAALGGLRHGWESCAGFADLDFDGRPELYVGNYVHFDAHSPAHCELAPGIITSCPPSRYHAEKGHLLRNLGGRFREITGESGIAKGYGKNLALGFEDYDRDGRPDMFVANDGTPANLFRNLGRLKFENVGLRTGCALSGAGGAYAAMGVAWGDYDRDGWPDLAVTTFSRQNYALYHNDHGFFQNESDQTGIARATNAHLGFGERWLDADNDGWLDLVFANGHVYDTTDRVDPGTTYQDTPQLFMNHEGRRFTDDSALAGPAFRRPIVGRGLATADIDRDGRTDLVIVDLEGRPELLRNVSSARNHWLTIRLHGPPGNPTGEGAIVTVWAGGRKQAATVTASGSYLSMSEPVAHFGLGSAPSVERLEVRWPAGRVQREPVSRVDCEVVVGYATNTQHT